MSLAHFPLRRRSRWVAFASGLVILVAIAVTVLVSARSRTSPSSAPASRASTPGSPLPTGAPAPRATTSGVTLTPGDDVGAQVQSAPPGTKFFFKNGVYDAVEITPKSGDTFSGQSRGNVILSGARPLSGWTAYGPDWVVGGQDQHGLAFGECQSAFAACDLPEQLFIDGKLDTRVVSLAQVTSTSWFFDYAAKQIFIGMNPAGHSIDTSVTPFVFGGTATGVTIEHLTVEEAASPTSSGAIDGRDGKGWLVNDVTARDNHGDGITLGSDSTAESFSSLDNGMEGIGAGVCCAEHGANTLNVVFKNGVVAGNNTAGYDPGWGGGGSKFVATNGLLVEHLYVHNNNGPGLWTDVSNVNTVFQDNVVVDNWGAGIFQEISSHAVIRDNQVSGNGFRMGVWLFDGGITVSASSDVEVYGNTVKDNYNGITGVMQDRGVGHTLTNLNVHDNVIGMRRGVTGISSGIPGSWYASAGNHFSNNKYLLAKGLHDAFSYGTSGAGSSMAFSEWRSLGQDTTGSIES